MSDVTPSTPPKHAWNIPENPPNGNNRCQLWQVIYALNTSTQNLADELTLADGLPQVIKNRCLEYHYTKLGRWTYFGQWTLQVIANKCLEYCYTKLVRWTYIGRYPVVWIWKDDLPPWRTSTYERPFTWEGNYLVFNLLEHLLLAEITAY